MLIKVSTFRAINDQSDGRVEEQEQGSASDNAAGNESAGLNPGVNRSSAKPLKKSLKNREANALLLKDLNLKFPEISIQYLQKRYEVPRVH